MARWTGTVEYTPILTGKRVWEIVEVEAPTLEAAIQKALLKTGIGPIRRQLTHVKVDIGPFQQYSQISGMYTYYFLFDEGLPTEERITVEASSDAEAAIKARDEFYRRRGVYHKRARITRRIPSEQSFMSFHQLEPIPETREERLTKVYELPIQPRAADVMGNLREVYDKIMEVPNEICWRCRLNIDSHCTAFLLVGSEKDQEYRRGSTALCAYVLQGRIVK